MRLFTFLVLAMLYTLPSAHCRRKPKCKSKPMKSFYQINSLVRSEKDSSSSEGISMHNRYPSLSCLLFSDAGCETCCNLFCDLYQCQSSSFCQNKMYCTCNEVYIYGNRALSADQYKQLSFDELWSNKFADTPLSKKIKNRISRDEDASMHIYGMLQNPHKTGNDIKSAIISRYPEYRESGLQQLQTRDLGIKKDLMSDHLNLEHYIQNMISKMKGSIYDQISHTRYMRRLIQLIKNIENKNDLKYILRQIRLTGNDRLYQRLRKYLIKKGIYFDDDEEFGLRGRRVKKKCGRCRKCRKCKDKKMFYLDDEDYDEDDEIIELALMNELMNTSVDNGQHFIKTGDKTPATEMAEDIAMANVMSLNNSPRPSFYKKQSETYFADEYPQNTGQNKLTSTFIQNDVPVDNEIITDAANYDVVENLPTPRPDSSITQKMEYIPTLTKTTNISPDAQYMEYFSSLPNVQTSPGTEFTKIISRPGTSTFTNKLTDVSPSSYMTSTSTSPGMNLINTEYLSSLPTMVQTQTLSPPIQNTDYLISNISPTEYLTSSPPSPVQVLPESIQKPVENVDTVTFDLSDTPSGASSSALIDTPIQEQPLTNTVVSEMSNLSPTEHNLIDVEHFNDIPAELIEQPLSNIDQLDTVNLSPAELTSSSISSVLENTPIQSPELDIQDEYLTTYDISDDNYNPNILKSSQRTSPDSYDYLISESDTPITQQTITSPQSEIITTTQNGKDNMFYYLIVDENGNILKRSNYNYPGQTTYTQTVTNIPGQVTHTTTSNNNGMGLLNSGPTPSTIQKITSSPIDRDTIPINEYYDEEAITKLMKNASPTQSTIQKITSPPTDRDILINEDYNEEAILNLLKNADKSSFGEKIDTSFLNNGEYDRQALLNALNADSMNDRTMTTIPGQIIHTTSSTGNNMGLMNPGTSTIQRINQGPTQTIQKITSTSPIDRKIFINEDYNEEAMKNALKNANQSVFGNKIDTSILNTGEYDRQALLNALKDAHQTETMNDMLENRNGVNRVAHNFQSGVNKMNINADLDGYTIMDGEQYEYIQAADDIDYSDGDYEVEYNVAVNDEDDLMNF